MKTFIKLFIIIISVCFFSCKNEKTEGIKILKEGLKETKTRLQDKKSLNKQEFEDAFPHRIGDYERDFIEVSEDMAMANGAFGNGLLNLRITDGAGPMGQSLSLFNTIYNVDENFKNSAKKKTIRGGQKIIEQYSDNGQASIEFIYIDRFHILLEGKKMTPEELWKLFNFDNYISSLEVLDDFDNKNTDRNH